MKKLTFLTSLLFLFMLGCGNKDKKVSQNKASLSIENNVDSTIVTNKTIRVNAIQKDTFQLNANNAIDFFFNYAKEFQQEKVRLTTGLGSFTILLYDNVPYHKANFIYLTKKGYFDNTQFHRVVPNFIIQGGNSDDRETSAKRKAIGRYLLPPDTQKGYKHHRGTISMPSSERNNPHKLASPFEFFIVVAKPGSYHLDGNYTPFGKVIEGMDVVDKISQVAIDKGEWPMQNVYIKKAEVY